LCWAFLFYTKLIKTQLVTRYNFTYVLLIFLKNMFAKNKLPNSSCVTLFYLTIFKKFRNLTIFFFKKSADNELLLNDFKKAYLLFKHFLLSEGEHKKQKRQSHCKLQFLLQSSSRTETGYFKSCFEWLIFFFFLQSCHINCIHFTSFPYYKSKNHFWGVEFEVNLYLHV